MWKVIRRMPQTLGRPQSSLAKAFWNMPRCALCQSRRQKLFLGLAHCRIPMAPKPLRSFPHPEPDLFGAEDRALPQGLRTADAFVTAEEERALIARFASLPLAPFQFGPFEGKR